MNSATQRFSSRLATLLAFLFVLGIASVRTAAATPVPGYVEHWSGFTGAGWGGGDFYANPGAGGQQGASDGFFRITTPGPSPFFSTKLGTTNGDAKYTGDWTAAGITQVKFWLDDVGNPDPLEMHFAIGSDVNLWQYDTGFIPPADSWAQFTVDLTSSTGWTHTITADASGTFASALANVARILIRHDHAPFMQAPDEITADVGLDELMLVGGGNTGVPVGGPRVARPVQMAVPYPNPSRGPVALSIESFDGSPIRIEIVDAAGRLVRHASLEPGAAGPRLWTRDGLTDAGAAAPAGYYRARAIGAAGGTSRALVRLSD